VSDYHNLNEDSAALISWS